MRVLQEPISSKETTLQSSSCFTILHNLDSSTASTIKPTTWPLLPIFGIEDFTNGKPPVSKFRIDQRPGAEVGLVRWKLSEREMWANRRLASEYRGVCFLPAPLYPVGPLGCAQAPEEIADPQGFRDNAEEHKKGRPSPYMTRPRSTSRTDSL